MDFDPYEGFEEEIQIYDEYDENAEIRILEVVSQHQIVVDRDLKARLEREFEEGYAPPTSENRKSIKASISRWSL